MQALKRIKSKLPKTSSKKLQLSVRLGCTFSTCNPMFAFLARSHGTVHDPVKNAKTLILMHFWVLWHYSYL